MEGLDTNFTQFSTRLSVVRKSKDASTRILAGMLQRYRELFVTKDGFFRWPSNGREGR